MDGNQCEKGMESTGSIRANGVSPHGHKGTIEMRKSGQCVKLLPGGSKSNLPSQIPLWNVLARLIFCYLKLIASLRTHLCPIPFRPLCGLPAKGTAYSKHRSHFQEGSHAGSFECSCWLVGKGVLFLLYMWLSNSTLSTPLTACTA